jgi:hypothetical protein
MVHPRVHPTPRSALLKVTSMFKRKLSLLLCGLSISFEANNVLARDYVSRITLEGGIVATITERDSAPQQFKIEGCSDLVLYCLVNGQVSVVALSGKPKTYLASITVVSHGRTYNLPVSNMYEPMSGTRNHNQRSSARNFGGHCFNLDYCTFRAVFGDGAQTYAAQWETSRARISRTIFTADSDVVDLFLSRIDPTFIEE